MSDELLRDMQKTQTQILAKQAALGTTLKTIADRTSELHQVVVVGTEGRRSLVSRVDVLETRYQADHGSLRPPKKAHWKAAVAIGASLVSALAAGAAIASGLQ